MRLGGGPVSQSVRSPSLRALTSRSARLTNFEIIDFVTGLYRSHQPTRLLAASRPCFGWHLWIAIFWKNLGILSSRLTIRIQGRRCIPALDRLAAAVENSQSFLEFTLL